MGLYGRYLQKGVVRLKAGVAFPRGGGKLARSDWSVATGYVKSNVDYDLSAIGTSLPVIYVVSISVKEGN